MKRSVLHTVTFPLTLHHTNYTCLVLHTVTFPLTLHHTTSHMPSTTHCYISSHIASHHITHAQYYTLFHFLSHCITPHHTCLVLHTVTFPLTLHHTTSVLHTVTFPLTPHHTCMNEPGEHRDSQHRHSWSKATTNWVCPRSGDQRNRHHRLLPCTGE